MAVLRGELVEDADGVDNTFITRSAVEIPSVLPVYPGMDLGEMNPCALPFLPIFNPLIDPFLKFRIDFGLRPDINFPYALCFSIADSLPGSCLWKQGCSRDRRAPWR